MIDTIKIGRRRYTVIDDDTPRDLYMRPTVNGQPRKMGLVPRDFSTFDSDWLTPDPSKSKAVPREIEEIPESEYDDWYDEQEELKSSLEHIRMRGKPGGGMVPSLDQDGVGYCWAHSVTHAYMLARMVRNKKYIPMSAFSVAAIIKNGADQGGWCGLALKYMMEHGIAPQSDWPQGERNVRQYNTAQMQALMKKYKVRDAFYDMGKAEYAQSMTQRQVASCLLRNVPCALDFNWWGHSVAGLRWVRVERGSWGILIWNSWSDNWENQGMSILRGSKARPDGAVAVYASMAA